MLNSAVDAEVILLSALGFTLQKLQLCQFVKIILQNKTCKYHNLLLILVIISCDYPKKIPLTFHQGSPGNSKYQTGLQKTLQNSLFCHPVGAWTRLLREQEVKGQMVAFGLQRNNHA